MGERVIYLMPSSTHKLTRTWTGPCVIVKKNSPYSYVIEFDGKRQWCHANHLRKYHDRVTSAVSNSCAVAFDVDSDFGELASLEIASISDELCEQSPEISVLSLTSAD